MGVDNNYKSQKLPEMDTYCYQEFASKVLCHHAQSYHSSTRRVTVTHCLGSWLVRWARKSTKIHIAIELFVAIYPLNSLYPYLLAAQSMIPRDESQLLFSSSSSSSLLSESDEDQDFRVLPPEIESVDDVVGSHDKRRSCLKRSLNRRRSSISTLGSNSSSSSSKSSSSSSITRYVTFSENVCGTTFVADWADPRVQKYNAKNSQGKKKDSPSQSENELRRVDSCYLEVMRKEKRERFLTGDGHSSSSSFSMSSSPFWDEAEWSPRGLEPHFDDETATMKSHQRVQSVLRILLLQGRGASWEDIANAYSIVSRRSHIEAHRRGMLDELEAHHEVGYPILKVLMENRKMKCSNGQTPEMMMMSSSSWIGERPERRSRRFSEFVVGELEGQIQGTDEIVLS